jgi:hypothetical protein
MWNYAELSKAAKAAGGPEKLLSMVEEGGKVIGRMEGQASMLPWIGIAAMTASALTAGVIRLADHYSTKKVVTQEAVNEAKAELVQGIKEYDAAHSEECAGDAIEAETEAEANGGDSSDIDGSV